MRRLLFIFCTFMSLLTFMSSSGMDFLPTHIRYNILKLKQIVGVSSMTTSLGIGAMTSLFTNRALNCFCKEQEIISSISNPVNTLLQTANIPCTITANYWSSLFNSIASRCFIPPSFIEKLKPIAANTGCRLMIAVGFGALVGRTFYKLARATNFFGLKTMLYQATRLKFRKYRFLANNIRTLNETVDTTQQTITQNNQRLQLQSDTIYQQEQHMNSLINQIINIEQEYKKKFNNSRQQMVQKDQQLQAQTDTINRQQQYIHTILAQIADTIKENPSRNQNLNQLTPIILSCIEERKRKENRCDKLIELIEHMLGKIEEMPESLKTYINQAITTEDLPLLTLIQKYGFDIYHLNRDTIHYFNQHPCTLFPFLENPEEPECSICCKSFLKKQNPRIRICGHILCAACYTTLMRDPCPYCRKDSDGNQEE